MKQFYIFIFSVLFFVSTPQQSNAQFLNRLKNHVTKKVSNEASELANKEADKAIEKSFDKVETEVDKKISGDNSSEQTSDKENKIVNSPSEARSSSKIFNELDRVAIAKNGSIIADPNEYRSVYLSCVNKGNIAKPGDVILYKTSEGSFGKLELIKVDRNSNDKTTFRYVTYNDDGSIKSQSDNFSVRGTYTFDLDKGTEEGTAGEDVDFKIQREDDNNTRLIPYTDRISLIEYKKLKPSESVAAVAEEATAKTVSGYKLFPFKSAIVEYKYEGNSKGSHVKYIDNYGYKQADYADAETKVFGMVSKEKSAVIKNGPKIYTIDYKTKTANVGVNDLYESYMNSTDKNSNDIGEQAMHDLGFEYSGRNEVVMGKNCKVYEGSLGEIWVWNNLPLKSNTRVLGIKVTETATKLEIDASVPNSKFEIPKNIEVNDVSAYADEQVTNEMMDDYYNSSQISKEEKAEIIKASKMSYSEYRDMAKKREPGLSEEEIKQAYEFTKEVAKRLK
jgi:hypothetical protein